VIIQTLIQNTELSIKYISTIIHFSLFIVNLKKG